MSFIHLHCHSYFSMMHGTAPIEALVRAAAYAGMKALALTDLNGLYGWVEFVQTCEHSGIKPLCGVDLTAGDASAVLLAKDAKGYERICRLASDFHLAAEPPLAKLMPPRSEAGQEVPLPRTRWPPQAFSLKQALLEDRKHLAVLTRDLALLKHLAHETGTDGLYAELVPDKENLSLLRLARELRIPSVASNDVFFLHPKQFAIHRVLRAIDETTTLARVNPLLSAVPARFFCDEAWMRAKLSYCPEAIERSARLAEELHSDWRLGETVFPPFAEFSREEAFFTLRWKCYQGARRRYGDLRSEVGQRLEYELKVIREKGFTHYFLVVDDIVRQAPRTCGRGSVAASLVSYCLGITHVDPIRHHLMFERFLNPGRRDPPDADIDFPWDERDALLDYVFEKYGPYRVAMVANHVRLQTRAAIREIAKVHGIPEDEMRKTRKRLFHMAPEALPEPWGEIVRAAEFLHDFPRHLSVHCGGVVIVPDDLRRYVPLERATKGVNIIQWEKDQTEDFGLVKIDLLGNRSLAVIRDGLCEVELNTGKRIAYENLDPTQDPVTQDLVKRGDTMGVFYIESPATRQLQQKAGVGDYEHLVIHSSIIRPAAHRYINEYVERLHGKPYDPVHPRLKEILSETYGIMVYQEDVTKTAMALAGFDAVDGDGLRKALSKKRPTKKLSAYREQFFAGATERGVDSDSTHRIWEMIMSFAGYSFCKPHSASYALVSYQSAFLRAHYPAEFMAAVIRNGGGYYSAFAYLSEARRMGLNILPPDINASELGYSGKERELRVGFQQIRHVAEKTFERIVVERKRGGSYRSLPDFLSRMKIDVAETKLLIRAGCFDRVAGGLNRPQLIWQLLQLHSPPWPDGGASPTLRGSSFHLAPVWIPPVDDYTEAERLRDEQELLGFLISRHPLNLYEEQLASRPYVRGDRMQDHIGKQVTMVGCLIADKSVYTAHDEPMAFMSFEDKTALYETVFFPPAYQSSVLTLNSHEPFWLQGRIRADHGACSLHIDRVQAVGL